MVSVHFFCFQLFNYRNHRHQIHCSRQGNRKKRRNKWRDVTYHTERDEKRKETDDKRSSKSAIKKSRVEERYDEAATEAIGTLYEGRTRHIVADKYGPPLFQMGDVVTIMKDTTPGVHWRFSYDKLGRITEVVNNEGSCLNLYTVKIIFERWSEEVDELWLQCYNNEETMNAVLKKKRTIHHKNIEIANLRGKLRVDREKAGKTQIELEKSEKIVKVLREQNDNMAEQISSFLCCDIVNENVIRKSPSSNT